ncbi:MAG: hypothetical protein Q7S87_01375 [Agitococcus sp.]|nr:hypothetical protein [Agitococcus sp.]MDO9177127.1 hypothetical protein [Agitococcus sp.]
MSVTVIKLVRQKLESEGFTGLFYSGECACECADLAPCGNAEKSANGFINGCKPGYKHFDPRPEHAKFGDFAIWEQQEAPTAEQWNTFSYD